MGSDPQTAGLVNALFSGDYKSLVMLALLFGIAHYGAFVIGFVAGKLKEGITFLKGKTNEISLFQHTTMDDRFFDLLGKAVDNQAHLQGALSEMVAAGTAGPEDLPRLVEAIWADFKANLGIQDWTGFAMQLLGNAQAPGAEKALRARFDANVHAVLGSATATVATRRMESRSMQARELIAKREMNFCVGGNTAVAKA